ncbi:MAG: HTTM domain-containing protein [Verrucomicrobiota bacterium]
MGVLGSVVERLQAHLGRQVDGSSLAVFRFFFGAVMFVVALRYLMPQGDTTLKRYLYDEPNLNFTYPALHWIQPFPEPLWTIFFVVLALAALGVAFGFRYREASIALFLCYSYLFLSEVAKYNNHYYLMCLVAFILAWMPAHRVFAFDRWRGKGEDRQLTVPFWTIFLLRGQLFLVYFFGGVAKFNADWLTGIPMVGKGHEVLEFWSPLVGGWGLEPIHVALFLCWGGLFYDLSIGFLLLFPRTRFFALGLTLFFHLSNHFLFPIGVFPFMAFTSTLIFLQPDWPRRLLRWVRQPSFIRPDWKWAVSGAIFMPACGWLLGWKDRGESLGQEGLLKRAGLVLVAAYFLIQVVLPFRHFFIAGDANWTEEGQDFSWRMMLRAKDASHVMFYVDDPDMQIVEEGKSERFQWASWPEEQAKTLFVPIDSSRFNWDHHQGLTATFEPNVGLRLIFRLGEDDDLEARRQQLRDQWKEVFGREVTVADSLGFEEALEELRRVVGSEGDWERLLVSEIASLFDQLPTRTAIQRESDLAKVNRHFGALLRGKHEADVRAILRLLVPFATQGGEAYHLQFFVVDDPLMRVGSKELERLTGGIESLVWIDLSRLRSDDWRELPEWFVTFEDRKLHVLWNHSNDLNDIQRKRFSTSPWMIRQLAIWIADRWEEQTGRRPKVRVVSNLMMNYRIPQPLIDPGVDLASVRYHHFRHNDWILPLSEKVGSATNQRRK